MPKDDYVSSREQWHRWFAWHPVDAEGTRVWLETVYRKGEFQCSLFTSGWVWTYALPENIVEHTA